MFKIDSQKSRRDLEIEQKDRRKDWHDLLALLPSSSWLHNLYSFWTPLYEWILGTRTITPKPFHCRDWAGKYLPNEYLGRIPPPRLTPYKQAKQRNNSQLLHPNAKRWLKWGSNFGGTPCWPVKFEFITCGLASQKRLYRCGECL